MFNLVSNSHLLRQKGFSQKPLDFGMTGKSSEMFQRWNYDHLGRHWFVQNPNLFSFILMTNDLDDFFLFF